MRVLVTSLPDLKKIAPQRPQQLLSFLSNKHDVTVFCVNAWWLNELSDPYLDSLLEKLDFSYITDRKLHPALQELCFVKQFTTLTEEFDLHVNFNSLIAGLYASTKMKRRGVPTLFDVADDLPVRIASSPHIPRPLHPLAYRTSRYLFKKFIDVSARSTLVTQSLLESYHLPAGKAVVVPNGVDTQLFHEHDESPLRSKLGLEHDFVVGFAGVLSRWVDLDQPFRALRELLKAHGNMKMLIVGDGEKMGELKRAVQELQIAEHVLFAGNVSHCELPFYIACMDVCLISYRLTVDIQNAFPLKLLEYMSCGKPVVSVDARGIREVAGHHVLYATSAHDIEQTLRSLYDDPLERERLAYEAMRFVREYFRWESAGADFERVARDVIDEASASAS